VTPRVLLLGGVDPSGGAGITADATVVALHRAEPLPIAVATTEQNRSGFRRCEPLPPGSWCRALHAVLDDGAVHAIKLGLLPDELAVRVAARELRPLNGRVPIVIDPVLSATAGGWTAPAAVAAAYLELLLPLATVVTPNVPELAALGGGPGPLLAAGAGAVLQKGGHGDGATSDDVLYERDGHVLYRRERLPCGPVRGTGCALAAAIAARLAHGAPLASACRAAGDWLAALLRALGPAPANGPPRVLPFGAVPPLR
jgi:hydroxymethylpyrimidine/phosphomethylpyrimidine kinase